MENISHTLAGLVMARAGLGGRNRLSRAALVVGSNLPDLDLLWSLRGRVAYLDEHRGVTHSLAGCVPLALALGLTLWGADRLLVTRFLAGGRYGVRRRNRADSPAGPPADPDAGPLVGSPARLGPLLGLSLLAALLHLAFDGLNDYGIRPFLPFSNRWYYGDRVFIADPWFWLILGGGLHLCLPAASRAHVVREVFAWSGWALLSAAVLLAPVPVLAKAIWVLGLLLLAALRVAGAFRPGFRSGKFRGPRNAAESVLRLPARAALLGLGLYCLGLSSLHGVALHRARAFLTTRALVPGAVESAVLPVPADPFHWRCFFSGHGVILTGEVSALPGGAEVRDLMRRESGLDDPAVRAALQTPVGRSARGFCRFLFAEVRRSPSGTLIAFRDARYAARGDDRWATFEVPLAGAGTGRP